MRNRLLRVLFGVILAVSCGLSGAQAWASSTFAITATNVTMPTSGDSSSTFTITNIPAAGTIYVSCGYSGTNSGARLPYCGGGPVRLYQVTAGETLTGSITLYPYGVAVPASLHRTPRSSGALPASGLALSGALLLGFGLRRKARRWLALAVFAVGALAGLTGISACGGSSNGMTRGTYPYLVTAEFTETGTTVVQGVSTTITVTVQ